MKKLKVSANDISKRLDVFVFENLPTLSRSFVQKLIDGGRVTVNQQTVKPGHKIKNSDQVKIDFNLAEMKVIPDITLPIIYEDNDVIVVDKPQGVLTHSKGAFNPEATVASFIKDKVDFLPNESTNDRMGIVHRLDRATSGVIICAKNSKAQKWLQKQFSIRKTKKTYIAVVDGILTPSEAVIDMPIARNPRNPKTFYISPSGKQALTHFRVKEVSGTARSTLILTPETGRTHQIRVHLHYLKHPIVGDVLYGGSQNTRMLLHAHKLELTLPDGKRHEFVAPIPKEFDNSMNE